MKSKVGIALCIVYALIIATFVMSAQGADNKGAFVLMQLPIAFQIGLVPSSLNLENLSWLNAYLLFATPTFLFLYFFGWTLERKSNSLNKNVTK